MNQRTFSFRFIQDFAAPIFVFFIILCVSIYLLINLLLYRLSEIGAYILFPFATIIIMIVGIYLIIYTRSDVVVDEKGLGRSLFGRMWKRLEWSKIKEIRILQEANPRRLLYVCDSAPGDSRPRHKFFFTDRIKSSRELLDIINIYVRKYNIEIFDCRSRERKRLDQL